MSEQPDGVWHVHGEISPALAAELRVALEAVQRGEVTVLDLNLPRRVRLRLAIERHLTNVGCWLIDRGHNGTAERLWRACRMF